MYNSKVHKHVQKNSTELDLAVRFTVRLDALRGLSQPV